MTGPAMVGFSYLQIPDCPIVECLEAIKAADSLGFYACYVADEGLLAQHGIDALSRHPIPRVREALHVMRTFQQIVPAL